MINKGKQPKDNSVLQDMSSFREQSNILSARQANNNNSSNIFSDEEVYKHMKILPAAGRSDNNPNVHISVEQSEFDTSANYDLGSPIIEDKKDFTVRPNQTGRLSEKMGSHK